jgi:hypothetical protein
MEALIDQALPVVMPITGGEKMTAAMVCDEPKEIAKAQAASQGEMRYDPGRRWRLAGHGCVAMAATSMTSAMWNFNRYVRPSTAYSMGIDAVTGERFDLPKGVFETAREAVVGAVVAAQAAVNSAVDTALPMRSLGAARPGEDSATSLGVTGVCSGIFKAAWAHKRLATAGVLLAAGVGCYAWARHRANAYKPLPVKA